MILYLLSYRLIEAYFLSVSCITLWCLDFVFACFNWNFLKALSCLMILIKSWKQYACYNWSTTSFLGNLRNLPPLNSVLFLPVLNSMAAPSIVAHSSLHATGSVTENRVSRAQLEGLLLSHLRAFIFLWWTIRPSCSSVLHHLIKTGRPGGCGWGKMVSSPRHHSLSGPLRWDPSSDLQELHPPNQGKYLKSSTLPWTRLSPSHFPLPSFIAQALVGPVELVLCHFHQT